MRLRNRKIYTSDSGTESRTMEQLGNLENQEEYGQGNRIGSVEDGEQCRDP